MSKKRLVIGKYKVDDKPVDIVRIGNSYKNQLRNNDDRSIHVKAKRRHIDDYTKRDSRGKNLHLEIADSVICTLSKEEDTYPLPWAYNKYAVGAEDPQIKEVRRHIGSVTVKGTPLSKIYVGSPDPSSTWY